MPDRIVSIDGVEHHFPSDFSDAEIAQALHGGPSTPAAQQRSRTGALYTPPEATGGKDLATFGETYAKGLNPMNIVDTAKAAYADPIGTAKEVAKTPFRLMGKLIGGHAPEALGEMGSMITLGGLAEALPGIRKAPVAPPEMINGMSVPDWKAAGVGDGSLDVMRNGRPKPIAGTLRMAPKTEPAPPTSGSSALQPEYHPVDAPVAKPSNWDQAMASPDVQAAKARFDTVAKQSQVDALQQATEAKASIGSEGVTPTRQAELLQKLGGTADPGQPLGPPRVMTLKETPTSWTPEAARARLEYNDWHSGAEPGSPEAKSAQALHRYEAETQSRYKYLLDSPNGFGRAELIANPGRIIPGMALEALGRHFGAPPWVSGMVGYAAPEIAAGAKAAAQSPVGNQALRAALLARMLSQQEGTSSPR